MLVHVTLKSVFHEHLCQLDLIIKIFEQKKYKVMAIMPKQNVSKYLEKDFSPFTVSVFLKIRNF